MDILLRRLALAVGLIFGVIGAQGPEFAQQYRQRLAGAIDELSRAVTTFDAEAQAQSLTPDQAIARLDANSDLLARERGRDMAEDKARLNRLKDAQTAFADGQPLQRLASFFATFDSQTARRAWGDFQPAVPTTVEAFVVAAISYLIGWAGTHIVVWPARRRALRKKTGAVEA